MRRTGGRGELPKTNGRLQRWSLNQVSGAGEGGRIFRMFESKVNSFSNQLDMGMKLRRELRKMWRF